MTTAWERLATFEGGSVADLAAAQAADGSWHVFAATAVGVFHSVDHGQTWHALMPAVAAVEVITPSPTFAQDGIVYLGAASGLYQWNGRHGQVTHLLSGGPVQTIAVIPADTKAATIFVGTQDDGILASRDGGRVWEGANAGLLDLCVEGIALSPAFPTDGIAFAATPDGLYRTRNGGEAWRALSLDLDDDDSDVVVWCVTVSPAFADDRIVLAGTEDYGLLRSDDGGRSWSRPPELADHLINRVTYFDHRRVIAALDAGLALSDDDGQTWRKVGGRLGGVAAGVLLPGDTPVLLAALPESRAPSEPSGPCAGVARSEDEGEVWDAPNVGLAAHLLLGLTLSPRQDQEPLVMISSLDCGVCVWTGAAANRAGWIEGSAARAVPQIALAQAPGQPSQLIAIAESRLTAAHLPERITGALNWHDIWPDAETVQTLAVSADGSAVIAAQARNTCRISLDGGTTWTAHALPADDGSAISAAVGPVDGASVPVYLAMWKHVGGSALSVWRSIDSAQNWQLWFRDETVSLSGAMTVVALPANPFGDSVVLANGNQVLRPRLNAWERREGVRRPAWDATTLTDDARPGWGVTIAGLAASPTYAQDRTLFAATSAGIFVSRDGAATWTSWSNGLEPAAIVSVAVSPGFDQDRQVYAIGLGGSVWRRADR